MFIYKITNKINNQCYIGQTTHTLEKRWNWHRFHKGCPYLYSAIKKYGKDNFTIKILEICKDLQELNIKERYWIQELKTLVPNGYNISIGGTDGTMLGRHHSEESKKKISKKLIGIKRSKRNKEYRYKLGKYSRNRIGKLHFKSTSIICLNSGEIFASIGEAGRSLKLSYQNIWKVIVGKRLSTGGLVFKYLEANNE